MSVKPFPPLPIEITIGIIEAAAATSLPTALALSLVSKATYRWTKPVLYSTVHISWHNLSRFRIGFFTHNFSYANDSLKSHSLIRSLFIADCSGPAVLHIVNRCNNLIRLLCDIDIIECTTTNSRPREVVMYPSSGSYTVFRNHCVPSVLQCVTHLFVKQGMLNDNFIRVSESLEHLTHLGLSFSSGVTKDQMIAGIERLLTIQSLKLIMIVSSMKMLRPLWRDLARIDDERLVVGAEVANVKDPIDEIVQRGSMWENIGFMRRWRLLVF